MAAKQLRFDTDARDRMLIQKVSPSITRVTRPVNVSPAGKATAVMPSGPAAPASSAPGRMAEQAAMIARTPTNGPVPIRCRGAEKGPQVA